MLPILRETCLELPTVKLLVEGYGGTVRALSNLGKGCKSLITYHLVAVRTD